MNFFSNYVSLLLQKWREQNTLHKFIIGFSLVLLVVAYLPTLQLNYATQDQWRAFRYSTVETSSKHRAIACASMISSFYTLTGRPLVWVSECIEHAVVNKITDFSYFRPLFLVVVLITALYLAYVLSYLLGNYALGLAAATICLTAPGYSFMYLQGTPALMVLFTIILSSASFDLLRKYLASTAVPTITFRDLFTGSNTCAESRLVGTAVEAKYLNSNRFNKVHVKKLIPPFLLFILSCMIYPVWAFIVLPLCWLHFCFGNKSLKVKSWRLCYMLVFYFFATICYYIWVKFSSFLVIKLTGVNPDLKGYSVVLQLSPNYIFERIKTTALFFYNLSPLNYSLPKGTFVLVLALFSVQIALSEFRKTQGNRFLLIVYFIFTYLGSSVILIAAISPWLFSPMPPLLIRHVMSWYLFFSVALVGLIQFAVKKLSFKKGQFIMGVALALCVFPVAIVQNKLSFFEAVVSNIEVEHMRMRLNEWLDNKGYVNNRLLLVVLPIRTRPAFLENLYEEHPSLSENFVLTSSQNPVSILWMINALLRERNDHPLGKSMELVDCGFDQHCINDVYSHPNKVALALTMDDKPMKLIEQPFIINNTTLTTQPREPVIRRLRPDTITTSSLKIT